MRPIRWCFLPSGAQIVSHTQTGSLTNDANLQVAAYAEIGEDGFTNNGHIRIAKGGLLQFVSATAFNTSSNLSIQTLGSLTVAAGGILEIGTGPDEIPYESVSTAGLARMNMILHDYASAVIKQCNTLASPLFTVEWTLTEPPKLACDTTAEPSGPAATSTASVSTPAPVLTASRPATSLPSGDPAMSTAAGEAEATSCASSSAFGATT